MEGGRQPLITDYLNKLAEDQEKQVQVLEMEEVEKKEEMQHNPEEEADKMQSRRERKDRARGGANKETEKLIVRTDE